MSRYNILFKPSVEKDLRNIPDAMRNRILEHIEGLISNPFPHQSIKLTGGDSFYRIRVGDYRVVYEADVGSKQIVIQYIRHRREVYRNL
jgi:mRNA interferase RelE/StbE